jgi:hypothetical protein
MRYIRIGLLSLMLLAAALMAPALAQGQSSANGSVATGTSRLVFNTTSLTFNGYGYYNTEGKNFTYNVVLESGTAGNTVISVVNSNYLFLNGILLVGNRGYGYPNYSGELRVQVSNFTQPGNYSMILSAAGADPASNATLAIIVLPWRGNLNTTPLAGLLTTVVPNKTTSTYTTAISSITTTIGASSGSSTLGPAGIVWIVVAIVVVIILILLYPRIRERLKYGM